MVIVRVNMNAKQKVRSLGSFTLRLRFLDVKTRKVGDKITVYISNKVPYLSRDKNGEKRMNVEFIVVG